MYANRVMEVQQATFTLLVFTTTGGMAEECRRYQSESQNSLLTRKGKSTLKPYRGSGQRCPSQSSDQPFYALEDLKDTDFALSRKRIGSDQINASFSFLFFGDICK